MRVAFRLVWVKVINPERIWSMNGRQNGEKKVPVSETLRNEPSSERSSALFWISQPWLQEHMATVGQRCAVSIIESFICSLLPWRLQCRVNKNNRSTSFSNSAFFSLNYQQLGLWFFLASFLFVFLPPCITPATKQVLVPSELPLNSNEQGSLGLLHGTRNCWYKWNLQQIRQKGFVWKSY